jgi:hypothetical protein
MKIDTSIFSFISSWGNKMVQVHNSLLFVYQMCFAVITLFFKFYLINLYYAKHKTQHGKAKR